MSKTQSKSVKKKRVKSVAKKSQSARPEDPPKLLDYIYAHRDYELILENTLTVAVYPNFRPIAYKNDKDELVGFDVDLIKTFARRADLKIKFVESNWDGIWDLPRTKKADVSIGGIGITKVRMHKHTAWSIPYFYVMRSLVYNKKKYDLSKKGFDNVILRGTFGSTGWVDAFEQPRFKNVKIMEEGKSDEEDINDLLSGKIQGFMRGSFVAKALVSEYKDFAMIEPWEIAPGIVSKDGECFAFPTRTNSNLAQSLSAFIAQSMLDGLLQAIATSFYLI